MYSEKIFKNPIKLLESRFLVTLLTCFARRALKGHLGIWGALEGHLKASQTFEWHSKDTWALEGHSKVTWGLKGSQRALRHSRHSSTWVLGHLKGIWAVKTLEASYLADSQNAKIMFINDLNFFLKIQFSDYLRGKTLKFLLCGLDEMFIRMPSFQERPLPALKYW